MFKSVTLLGYIDDCFEPFLWTIIYEFKSSGICDKNLFFFSSKMSVFKFESINEVRKFKKRIISTHSVVEPDSGPRYTIAFFL